MANKSGIFGGQALQISLPSACSLDGPELPRSLSNSHNQEHDAANSSYPHRLRAAADQAD